MSHNTDERAREDTDRPSGLEVEKWILRSLLVSLLLLSAAALVGSLDDLKRYVKIRRM